MSRVFGTEKLYRGSNIYVEISKSEWCFVDKEEKGRTGEEAAGARPGAGVASGVWRMVMARENRGTVWDPWK